MTAEEVHQLLSATCVHLNKPESGRRDWWIFTQVLGDTPESLAALNTFLKDVTTCPPEVIAFCQKLLAPQLEAA